MSLPKITAGGFSSFSLNSNGEIKGYGPDFFRMITDIPKGFGYKDISTAFYYALAINSNNEIVGWGSMTSHIYHDREREEPIERSEYLKLNNQVKNIPKGRNYIAIAACSEYSLSLTSKGELVGWGTNHLLNMWKIPEGSDFIKISVGIDFAMALRRTGEIEYWGYHHKVLDNRIYRDISASRYIPVGLRRNGTIDCWNNEHKAPEGKYVAISAGDYHALAIGTDSSLVIWGSNQNGQLDNIPKGKYVSIAAGAKYSMALDSEGVITIWGKVDDTLDVNEKYVL